MSCHKGSSMPPSMLTIERSGVDKFEMNPVGWGRGLISSAETSKQSTLREGSSKGDVKLLICPTSKSSLRWVR